MLAVITVEGPMADWALMLDWWLTMVVPVPHTAAVVAEPLSLLATGEVQLLSTLHASALAFSRPSAYGLDGAGADSCSPGNLTI